MDMLTGLGGPTFDISIGITLIFQILYFVLLTGYVLYAFLLTLRIRIISETVEIGNSKAIMTIVYLHLVIAIIGSFLAFLLALLA